MRIAALYDIHANLPALEAVLADVDRLGVDTIVIGGDVVPGPMPRETIDRLQQVKQPVRFIRGNGDREVMAFRRGEESAQVPEAFRESMRWNAAQLTQDDERMIDGWPETARVEVAGIGDILFCHATPRNDTEIFTRLTPAERLAPIFDATGAAVVVCGHTHMPFDRTIGRTRVVNAGSVGMPFGQPGAHWLLLGPDVELRRTEYDLTAAAERIRSTAYPIADMFATQYVLQPPAEDSMLAAFAKAELKI